jgi:Propeptide_C25
MEKWFLSLFLLSILLLNSKWIDLPQTDKELFECSITENGLTRIEFTLDGYEQENESVDGVDYYKISYINEGAHLDAGKPSLPKFSRLIAVNENSDLSFQIIGRNEQVVNNVVIYPSQELPIESQKIKFPFSIDESFYQSDNKYPQNQIEIETVSTSPAGTTFSSINKNIKV